MSTSDSNALKPLLATAAGSEMYVVALVPLAERRSACPLNRMEV